jgi:hypothetical protein
MRQVDRQMKTASRRLKKQRNGGKEIKKAYPVMQVSVYDAEEHETKDCGVGVGR